MKTIVMRLAVFAFASLIVMPNICNAKTNGQVERVVRFTYSDYSKQSDESQERRRYEDSVRSFNNSLRDEWSCKRFRERVMKRCVGVNDSLLREVVDSVVVQCDDFGDAAPINCSLRIFADTEDVAEIVANAYVSEIKDEVEKTNRFRIVKSSLNEDGQRNRLAWEVETLQNRLNEVAMGPEHDKIEAQIKDKRSQMIVLEKDAELLRARCKRNRLMEVKFDDTCEK